MLACGIFFFPPHCNNQIRFAGNTSCDASYLSSRCGKSKSVVSWRPFCAHCDRTRVSAWWSWDRRTAFSQGTTECVLRSATQGEKGREGREAGWLISPQAVCLETIRTLNREEEAFMGAGDRSGQAVCMQSSSVHNCEMGSCL